MRTSAILLATIRTSLSVSARVPLTAAPPAAACTSSAGTTCTQWVTLNGGPTRSMVYSTYSLTTSNPGIRRALIMVHGTNRNADHYFETATAAAFLAGALDDTIVIAPHMIDGSDKAQENEVVWQSSWRTGGRLS
jgi:pimeloyl-ACP methyl ester carboxylesterase